jgi:hypothetical protein
MDHRDIVGMPFVPEFIRAEEIRRRAAGEVAADLVLAVLEETMEDRGFPCLLRPSLVGEAIFGDVVGVRLDIAPFEGAAFEIGMQRVDQGERIGDCQPGGVAVAQNPATSSPNSVPLIP